jgi:ATP-binding cassette, subfamily C (CFTR/MRP), member 1
LLVLVSIPIGLRDISANAQKEWLRAIESRVASTASYLSSIKAIKMTGLSDRVSETIQASRIAELQISGKFRKLLGLSVGISTLSQSAVPVMSLITYTMVMRANGTGYLDTATAFTTLSLVSLLAYPIKNISAAAPRVAAAVGCFQRIQEYILSCGQPESDPEASRPPSEKSDDDIELRNLSSKTGRTADEPMLKVERADFTFSSAADPILREIDMSLTRGTWTILTGPVGSGKSVLLLALLKELKLVAGSLSRHHAAQIGYCAQDPWLPNLSIRQIILANQGFDGAWYSTVIDACRLNIDFSSLPAGDETVIGSNGVSLSGGQKQRVSLARAVYSRKSLLILDDVLSGLDPVTEQAIVDNVFADGGILRKHGITVLLATHSGKSEETIELV